MKVSGAQISNFFKILIARSKDTNQNVPKNGSILAQAKIPNFGPIDLCLMVNMGFLGSQKELRAEGGAKSELKVVISVAEVGAKRELKVVIHYIHSSVPKVRNT